MAFTTKTVYNSVRGALGLFSRTNKGQGDQDPSSDIETVPEYESKLSDEDILGVINVYKQRWDDYIKEIEIWQKDNERYWLGKQYNPIEQAGTTKRALVDNAIFEAVETALPIMTQQNPDPMVASDNSPEGQKIAYDVKQVLQYQADRQKLRMILASATRHWMLDFLGAIKVYWDVETDDNATDVVRTKKLILDPDAYIDEGGRYHGEYLGEYKKWSVKKLKQMFPKKASEIDSQGGEAEGTRLNPIEWWTPTDVFYTLGDEIVLGKFKNPTWNWDSEVELPNPEDPESTIKHFVKGTNHLDAPFIPYLFITVFNLGKQPHDETGLIYQVIPQQDQINEREIQFAKNVKRMNNGIALNGLFYTKEQASQALTQLENGGGLWVPNNEKVQGRLDEAFKFTNPPALSADVYQMQELQRERLTGIFGTAGSTPQGINQQKDVRGKIMAQQQDSSRIGGGITTKIEQVADSWFNYQLQLMYVNYDEQHYAAAVGDTGAQEIITIHNQDLNRRIMVTVKEGSLIPKDALTERNEAMDLWSAGAIDPITLFKKLDYPDPYNAAKQTLMWELIKSGGLQPQVMFPDFPQTTPVIPAAEGPTPAPAAPQAPQPGAAPAPTTGVGGPAVNPLGSPQGEVQPPSQPAVQQKSQQLLASVPIK